MEGSIYDIHKAGYSPDNAGGRGMKTPGIVCVGALRSPMGKFGGGFKAVAVYDLAAPVIRRLLASLDLPGDKIDEVLIGNCRQAGNGPNPGRTAAVKGGVPLSVPVATINTSLSDLRLK